MQPIQIADRENAASIHASTRNFPLRAAFGQDGSYLADILPTRVGDFQWIFTGTINGDQVNETFDTADGRFGAVQRADPPPDPPPISG
jgi:hypothetical protein